MLLVREHEVRYNTVFIVTSSIVSIRDQSTKRVVAISAVGFLDTNNNKLTGKQILALGTASHKPILQHENFVR